MVGEGEVVVVSYLVVDNPTHRKMKLLLLLAVLLFMMGRSMGTKTIIEVAISGLAAVIATLTATIDAVVIIATATAAIVAIVAVVVAVAVAVAVVAVAVAVTIGVAKWIKLLPVWMRFLAVTAC